jgi:hypothetical protein
LVSPTPIQTPTITPYPTFLFSAYLTLTPVPPAVCPEVNQDFTWTTILPTQDPENPVLRSLDKFALTELSAGASIDQVAEQITSSGYGDYRPGDYYYRDVTGDKNPELIFDNLCVLIVAGCRDGEYVRLLEYPPDPPCTWFPSIVDVTDINRNGTSDLIVEYDTSNAGNNAVQIFEWDGSQFNPLVKTLHSEDPENGSRLERGLFWYEVPYTDDTTVEGYAPVEFHDLNGDGVKELILDDDGPGHWDTVYNFGPWRGKTSIYTWDGQHYLYNALEMDPPEFRFQAVQDADRLFYLGYYDRALGLYREVIFSDALEWWTSELREFNIQLYDSMYSDSPTPIPVQEDPAEYDSLAAYARYRIVLHHLTRGWLDDAITVNDSLQKLYGAKPDLMRIWLPFYSKDTKMDWIFPTRAYPC